MFLVFAFSAWTHAQSARARIVGTVKDQQGAVVPGASVIVTNTATGVSTTTTTDSDGSYQALELPIGSYRVKVQKDG
ncbi:MAG TPA: carboxypeptidase-like regulatory domain-containing protein, partial [Candidatus Saccharimonadales bacterium]|nr:carboxypeptidase-like regulatory domain-containing protein [Candidatus Saccharimonadales bacterium]